MLTQQRHEIILKLLKEKGSITVTEVRDLLDTSESTVRRDITALDKEGKLEKVFGGAVEAGQKVTAHEYTVAQKNELNCDAKRKIAEYAASPVSYTHLRAHGIPHRAGRFRLSRRGNDNGAYDRFHPGNLRRFRDKRRRSRTAAGITRV